MTTPTNKTTGTRKAAPKTAAKKAPARKTTQSKTASPAKPKATPAAAPKTTAAKPAASKPAVKQTPKEAAKTPAPKKEVPAPVAKKAATVPTSVPAPAYDAKLEQMASQMQKGYEEMFGFGFGQMEKMFKVENVDAFKSYEEAMAFSKENVDALMKSSSIAAKGVQDVTSLFAEITQKAVEENIEASKKIMECKTPQEAVELQTELLKSGYDKMMAEVTRLSEVSSKIAEEAMKPLKECFDKGVSKINDKAA